MMSAIASIVPSTLSDSYVAIVMLAPTACKHVLLLGFQHGEFADLGEVMCKTGFSAENR